MTSWNNFDDVCQARVNFPDADFWVIARGSEVGKPIKTFDANHIGIKVTATDVLLPNYLYYVMLARHMNGAYNGMDRLRTRDLRKLEFVPTSSRQ